MRLERTIGPKGLSRFIPAPSSRGAEPDTPADAGLAPRFQIGRHRPGAAELFVSRDTIRSYDESNKPIQFRENNVPKVRIFPCEGLATSTGPDGCVVWCPRRGRDAAVD